MSEQEHWQLDGSAAELYQRYLVPAITSIWAADLIERVAPKPGESVLDLACGTGAVTRLAATRMGEGRVVGLDLNGGMLAVARTGPKIGAPIGWIKGSALNLPFDDGAFDLVFCQLGLQFFPDRPLALREMNRVLAPTGRVALSVYSAIERTPAADAFARALDRRLGPEASQIKRSEHIFPVADEVGALMSREGFDHIDLSTVTKWITFPSVLDYVRFQLIATPMAELLGNTTAAERDLIKSIVADTQSFLGPEMWCNSCFSFPQEAHIAIATRAL
jgi:ubiquinone/menaquinone biosynthesis C-methylase UbiE